MGENQNCSPAAGGKPGGYDVNNVFTYHPPFGTQQERYTQLRAEAKNLAEHILDKTPRSREQSLALTKLEEAVFWANAAIARNEQNPNGVAEKVAA